MPSSLQVSVERIRENHFAFPPATQDELDAARARGVPNELLAFYALCDGAFIGDGDDFADPNGRRFRLMIPRLKHLITTQSYGYIFDDSPLFEQTSKWWQNVDYGDSNWLAFDGSSDFNAKKIIDVFHETVGEPGSHEIVADSMSDLLDRLLQRNDVYWFDDDFHSLGSI